MNVSELDAIKARRDERKARLQAEYDAQRAIDLEALDALEVQLGDSNVTSVDVPFTPGLPTLAAARTPKTIEMKRYREALKHKAGEIDLSAATQAAEQLAVVCREYPEPEVFAKMCEARSGLKAQLGVAATKLSSGKAATEGKE